MKPLIASIIMSLIAIGCEEENLAVAYVIKKGEHYASNRAVESLQSNTLEFYAMFDQSAIYDFGDEALQTNKNKLLGFADCNSSHHENSARFAWQWYHGKLEIFAYCYVNGVRTEQYVGDVAIGSRNKYKITRTPSHYEFSLNGAVVVRIPRGNTCSRGLHYLLWPYFGGSVPAPHDITILIERIYS